MRMRLSVVVVCGLLPCAGAGRAAPVPVSSRSVTYWLEVVRAGDTLARQDAAEELGKRGPEAEAAIPALIAALQEPHLRGPAARALARIGPRAAPALVRALKGQEGVAGGARAALVRMGTVA